jgi:Gas vesicle protein K
MRDAPMSATEPGSRPVGASRGPLDLAGRLCGDFSALDDFARELGGPNDAARPGGDVTGLLPRRINTDQASVEKDLAKLVLALVDLVRRLMERQAIRRINAGSLSEDEVERMGETFLKLDRRMAELTTAFGLRREDLEVNLGPIRNLM